MGFEPATSPLRWPPLLSQLAKLAAAIGGQGGLIGDYDPPDWSGTALLRNNVELNDGSLNRRLQFLRE